MTHKQLDAREARRTEHLLLAAMLLVWLAVSLPLLLGTSTLFRRDTFALHLPLKAYGAQELANGRVPHFNTAWGLGQPFRGDPNALPLYPGNLLYLLLPFWSAFNAHYCLHWLLAFLTMHALARVLDMSRAGALMSALTYAGGGWLLSNLTFYNILPVVAWWPLVLLGIVRDDRRGLAIGGLACGLALLGGDPVSAALGIPLMVLAGRERHDWRRTLARVASVGSLGLLFAMPQIVATARIVGFASRTAISKVTPDFALHPLRVLELVLPLPWGEATRLGPGLLLTGPLFDRPPFILTLHIGLIALVLVAGAAKRHRRWTYAGLAGLLAASLGVPLERLSQGAFRYPEKFLFWFAFGTALLAGWGLGELSKSRAPAHVARGLVALCALIALIVLLYGDPIIGWLGSDLSPDEISMTMPMAKRELVLGAAISGMLAVASLWCIRRQQVAVLVLLQILALLRLHPVVPVDDTSPYRDPAPWADRVGPDAGVLMATTDPALTSEDQFPLYRMTQPSIQTLNRISHLDLDYPTGTLHGLRYPLLGEGAGLGSPLTAIVRRNLARLEPRSRMNWFRVMGVRYSTRLPDTVAPGMQELDRVVRSGVPTVLVEIDGTAPRVWWPETVVAVQSADAAFRHVSTVDEPVASVAVPSRLQHAPGASVTLLEEQPDRLSVRVSGDGGILAVQRAYHPLLRATADGEAIRTLSLQFALLGVEVPPGDRLVEIKVDPRPDRFALLGPFVALLAVVWLWATRGPRPSPLRQPGQPEP